MPRFNTNRRVRHTAGDPDDEGLALDSDSTGGAVPIEVDDVVAVLDIETGDEIEIDLTDLELEDDDAPTSVGGN